MVKACLVWVLYLVERKKKEIEIKEADLYLKKAKPTVLSVIE